MTNAVNIAQSGSNNVTMRNRIINGAMTIDQRRAGASVANNTTGVQFVVDRMYIFANLANRMSYGQNLNSITPPPGFTNYSGIQSTTANSPASTDNFIFYQWVEGFNVADLAWGTANAQPVTVSFWARSSLTGTMSGSIINDSQNRAYPFTYTISNANTWEYKTITIPGDTTGTWLTNNGSGLGLIFNLGSGSSRLFTAGSWQAASSGYGATGSVNILGTNGATFYITGVQLEEGTAASPFEYRLYGTELQLCQRYFISYGGQQFFEPYGTGTVLTSTRTAVQLGLPVPMRTPPAMVVVAPTSFTVNDGGNSVASTSLTLDTAGFQQIMYNADVASGLTVGRGVRVFSSSTLATRIQLSSEL